jgi:hypothetical protein
MESPHCVPWFISTSTSSPITIILQYCRAPNQSPITDQTQLQPSASRTMYGVLLVLCTSYSVCKHTSSAPRAPCCGPNCACKTTKYNLRTADVSCKLSLSSGLSTQFGGVTPRRFHATLASVMFVSLHPIFALLCSATMYLPD